MERTTDRFTRPRRVAALLTAGGLALTLLAVRTLLHSDGRDDGAPRADAGRAIAGGCRFAAGDVRAWRLTQRFARGDRELGRLSVVLTARATSVDATSGATVLAAQLSAVEASERGLRERLVAMRGVAFAMRMGADCAITEVGFAAGTDPARAQPLRGLVWPFDVTMPTGDAPARWIAQQREGPGDVSVRYARADGAGYERQRVRFVRRAQQGPDDALPEIVASSARFRLADDGRWLAELTGDEVTRVMPTEGAEGVELRASLELRAVEASWMGQPPTRDELTAMDFVAHPITAAPVEAPVDPAVNLALEPAVARLGALFDQRQNGAATEAVDYLVAYLRAHPERAAEILQWIRRRTYPERLGAISFFAMSKVHDPRVREALVGVVEDTGYTAGDRVRASFALADSHDADTASVERLARVARGAGAASDDEVARDGALNAVGAIRAHATGEVAEAAGRVLREAIDGARTPAAQRDALDAIGNARDRSFLPDAREALRSDAPGVRESAAGALATMDDATVEALLRERLRVEADPAVGVALVRAILDRTGRRPGAETVAVGVARLPREPSAELRLALVELLGAAAAWSGEAREAMVRWFPEETDARVQSAIGRYLPAEALAPARDR